MVFDIIYADYDYSTTSVTLRISGIPMISPSCMFAKKRFSQKVEIKAWTTCLTKNNFIDFLPQAKNNEKPNVSTTTSPCPRLVCRTSRSLFSAGRPSSDDGGARHYVARACLGRKDNGSISAK
jgi:hypothetical protein